MSLQHNTIEQRKNNDSIMRLITPMIAGILVCMFLLANMTWAWFAASVNTLPQTIQAASRSTTVTVYEISPNEGSRSKSTKALVKPKTNAQTDKNGNVIVSGETVVWELSPEKSYEIVLTGSGTATVGYCKIDLSSAVFGDDTAETMSYITSEFEKDCEITFTYNTGGFSGSSGVTYTIYNEYVETAPTPTLSVTSYWGTSKTGTTNKASLMSSNKNAKKTKLLSDGDVFGLEPIPCPEPKAETDINLNGFEGQKSEKISTDKDYAVSLKPQEGYEMPDKVTVNIGGKDYVISTQDGKTSNDAPYFDSQTGILTVPSPLLGDGVKVSVKASANKIPENKPSNDSGEKTEEESSEKPSADNKSTEDNTSDISTPSGGNSTDSSDNNDAGNPSSNPSKAPVDNDGNAGISDASTSIENKTDESSITDASDKSVNKDTSNKETTENEKDKAESGDASDKKSESNSDSKDNGTSEVPKSSAEATETKPSTTDKTSTATAHETSKTETSNTEISKTETPKAETPKAETPKAETPKAETPKAETPKAETSQTDASKANTLKPTSNDGNTKEKAEISKTPIAINKETAKSNTIAKNTASPSTDATAKATTTSSAPAVSTSSSSDSSAHSNGE